MRRRKIKLREAYVEAAIIITLIVFFAYSWLYLYSASDDKVSLKLTNDACKDFNGVCRNSCFENEKARFNCDDGIKCCTKLYEVFPEDKVYMMYALKNNSIDECNKIKSEEIKADCKLEVMDNLN
ncbi:hypothetical protein D6777_00935, partial [Candidatus Woesearchaeota archaeon]